MKALLLLFIFTVLTGCKPSALNDDHKSDMEELTPSERNYREKILAPEWDLVEAHFECVVPPVLKNYYADPKSILRGPFDLKTPKLVEGYNQIHVEFFTLINESSIQFFEFFEKYLDIASDGGEGLYFVDPTLEDPEVFFFIMDGRGLHPTGLSLSEFLSNPRLEPTDYWDD